MRWRSGRRSQNIEDRRGAGGGFGGGGIGLPFGLGRRRGGGGRLPGGLRRGGIGGIGLIVAVLAMLYLGIDPRILLQGGLDGGGPNGGGYSTGAPPAPPSPEQEELTGFVSVVLADTEDTWNGLFAQAGETYQEPTLVLFSDAVQSACGFAQSAVGPFYCPGDRKVYLDLAFFRDLKSRFQAPGDFAQAYVVAHEVGHHVQTLMGISERVHSLRRQASEADANALSVRMELQADCLAGLWAHHAQRQRQILEPGDVEEALNAASAIGDDRLQRRTGGTVQPDSFTHGSSEQRVRWFNRGFESGDLGNCDTFGADSL